MFNIPDKVYDFLSKFQRWLPAIGTAYIALADIWSLPLGDAINRTIAVICTLLASYLEVCSVAYEKRQNSFGVDIGEYVFNEDVVEHEVDEGEG